jgi:hypothetical protein
MAHILLVSFQTHHKLESDCSEFQRHIADAGTIPDVITQKKAMTICAFDE